MILISHPHSFDSTPLPNSIFIPTSVSMVKGQENLYETNGHLGITSIFQGNQDLIKLYRKFSRTGDYNKIKISSQKCPYCEVNLSTTIDHVLAKTNYPEFSIFWLNLVPCCSDCNHNKGTTTQFFHPYTQHACPSNNWLKATFQFDDKSKNIYFRFSVINNQSQFAQFFDKLKLSQLYASAAGQIYTNCIRSWKFLAQTNLENFKEHVEQCCLTPADIVSRTVHQALLEDWTTFISILPHCA
ncbi:MAG: HNH endonuclease [Brevinema sp.]